MIGRLSSLVLVLLAGCGAAPQISDAALVYCAAHRSETVDAAVALGLADSSSTGKRIVRGGNDVEFDEWRRTSRGEFEKACKAAAEPHMQPQAPASSPPWVVPAITAALSLFATALGWWISWVTTNRREDRNRVKAHAEALHRASREFVDEVRDYCGARLKALTTPAEVRRKRDQLTTQLAVTKLERPEWAAPDVLRAELAAVDDMLEEGWDFDDDRSEMRPRAEKIVKAAEALDRRIGVVVRALRRPRAADELLAAEFGQVVGA